MTPSPPLHPRSRSGLFAETAAAVLLLLGGILLWVSQPSVGDGFPSNAGLAMLIEGIDGAALLFLTGLAMLLAVIMGGPTVRRSDRGFDDFILVAVIPLGLAGALAVNRIIHTKTGMIGGERYFWLDDDGMISMRYAWNLAKGAGLVWNEEGPRVEGFTNFLWVIAMAVPHMAGLPARLASLPLLATNVVFLVLLVVELIRIGRILGLASPTILIAGLLVAGNRSLVYWTAGGSEAVALAWLVLLGARRVLGATRVDPLGWGTGLAAGAMALLRADGIVLMAAFLPVLVMLLRMGRARWSAVAAALIPVAALFIFRKAYYGEWLPNTYFLKTVDIPMKSAVGVHYARDLMLAMGGGCVLAVAGFVRGRNPAFRLLGIVPATGVAYAVMVGGDELGELRFLAPVLPMITLGAAAGAQRMFTRRAGRNGFGWMALALALAHHGMLALPGTFAALGRDRGRIEQGNVRTGLLIKRNTRPAARVAHYWAGAAAYFSERPAEDMLGKNDAHIARLPGRPGQFPPGHTKYDPAYSLGLRPDVVVTAMGAEMLEPALRPKPFDLDYPALYALYDEPAFQTDYAPGLVGITADFHAVFVRRDSALADPPDQWKE